MDKIISEIKSTADKVVKKSVELAELSKIKLSIASTKSEIGANYKTLGELVYLAQKSEKADNDKITEIIEKIDKLNERLEELNEIYSSLKNEKICPDCSKANPMDQAYCGSCGHKFETAEEEVYEGDVIDV